LSLLSCSVPVVVEAAGGNSWTVCARVRYETPAALLVLPPPPASLAVFSLGCAAPPGEAGPTDFQKIYYYTNAAEKC
jgi:hypothetical protein